MTKPTNICSNQNVKILRVVRELVRRHKLLIPDENEESNTALHLACLEGHPEVVKVLLEHGAEVEARNTSLWTPLDCASAKGHVYCVHLLLDYDAPLDPLDKVCSILFKFEFSRKLECEKKYRWCLYLHSSACNSSQNEIFIFISCTSFSFPDKNDPSPACSKGRACSSNKIIAGKRGFALCVWFKREKCLRAGYSCRKEVKSIFPVLYIYFLSVFNIHIYNEL